MSRLKELIDELCPDGVEYKTLGEVAPFVRERANTGEVRFDAYVGVDALLQNKEGRDTTKTVIPDGRHVYFRPGDTLLGNIRPYLKKIWFADCFGGTNGDVLVFRSKGSLEPKYLYYAVSSDSFFVYDDGKAKGSKMPRGDKGSIQQYRIPVPPIEVQREIVRILDSFQELDDALTAEIEARETQLDCLRERVYSDEVYPLVPLGSVGVFERGKRFTRAQMGGTGVPCIHYGDIYTKGHHIVRTPFDRLAEDAPEVLRYASRGDVVIAATSENAEDVCTAIVWDCEEDAAVHDDCQILHHKQNPLYLSLFFNSEPFMMQKMKYVTESKVVRISGVEMAEIRLSLPSIEVQNRIANNMKSMLHLMDALRSERDARRKQFEYYRDKLLDFPEKAR